MGVGVVSEAGGRDRQRYLLRQLMHDDDDGCVTYKMYTGPMVELRCYVVGFCTGFSSMGI